jgi:hypothetical protein
MNTEKVTLKKIKHGMKGLEKKIEALPWKSEAPAMFVIPAHNYTEEGSVLKNKAGLIIAFTDFEKQAVFQLSNIVEYAGKETPMTWEEIEETLRKHFKDSLKQPKDETKNSGQDM